MTSTALQKQAGAYLKKLCSDIPTRQVGSQGNRDATAFFRSVIRKFGYETAVQSFDCIDMRTGEIHLSVGDHTFKAHISPYSLGCHVRTNLVEARTIEELQHVQAEGQILLLRGDLTREQLMPKNFVFYNPESHQHIYQLLESKQPAAIITATGRNPELAGALYPFPLIEDGDFDIPSAYMTDVEGERLSTLAGREVILEMDAERIPARAENVIALKPGLTDKKIVVCAHIDAKAGTPGALDNAGGCAVLLLLGELLAGEQVEAGIEIVAFNGEDYYSAGGQMAYLASYEDLKSAVDLAINLDGLGYRGHATGLSFYNCNKNVTQRARAVAVRFPGISEMPQWYQGDHMIFAANQVPALAFTTTGFEDLEAQVAHTEKDLPQLVDLQLLAEAALALCDLIKVL